MPTFADIYDVVQRHNFACKLDLSEAYWSIPVRECDQAYLGMELDDKCYVWSVIWMLEGSIAYEQFRDGGN